jgi:hypothetical protein
MLNFMLASEHQLSSHRKSTHPALPPASPYPADCDLHRLEHKPCWWTTLFPFQLKSLCQTPADASAQLA